MTRVVKYTLMQLINEVILFRFKSRKATFNYAPSFVLISTPDVDFRLFGSKMITSSSSGSLLNSLFIIFILPIAFI